jgi:hypothetical protein
MRTLPASALWPPTKTSLPSGNRPKPSTRSCNEASSSHQVAGRGVLLDALRDFPPFAHLALIYTLRFCLCSSFHFALCPPRPNVLGAVVNVLSQKSGANRATATLFGVIIMRANCLQHKHQLPKKFAAKFSLRDESAGRPAFGLTPPLGFHSNEALGGSAGGH